MLFTPAQSDRAAGVLLGLACGDALDAGYRSGAPVPDEFVTMTAGGRAGRTPGEWSDDTRLAIPIARAGTAGRDLRDQAVQGDIIRQWGDLAEERPGQSAGSGSLMRTAPVALSYLDDPAALAEAARTLSDLTDDRSDAGDACVLWSLAVRHAIRHGGLELRVGLELLPADRRELWLGRIEDAERLPVYAFVHTDEAVAALQGAWSALTHLFLEPEIGQTDADFLRQCIENAVQERPGGGLPSVAALTGGLAGAHWGSSAVPAEWRRILHGRNGLRAGDLVRLAARAANGGEPDADGWPDAKRLDYAARGDLSTLVRHPHDDGVWLGAIGALDGLPVGVDAVVSLCRVGVDQVPARILEHIEVWMLEDESPESNPNLDFVLVDTVDEIAALRAEGHTVLVHCVQGQCCTATVAALYASRHRRIPMGQAMAEIELALPGSHPIVRSFPAPGAVSRE
jgi:ADP-ribosyl-[dinitrogen reductase] hydrolase